MRRQILSIAVSRFADPALAELPFAEWVRGRLVAAAEACGYEAAEPPDEPSAAMLGAWVREAVAGASPDDVLIVHVLSHGRAHGSSVQVYGSDGLANSGTSLDAWLADATGVDEHEDPLRRPGGEGGEVGPWILFLVDVCGAGHAARAGWQFVIGDDRRRAWVIAGCLPDRPGFNGRFTEAVANVFTNLSTLDIHPSYRYVPLDRVAQAVRDEVGRLAAERNGYSQTVVATRVDIATRLRWPPFFDNPHRGRTVAGSVPGDLREFAAAVEDLFDAWHFMSRAAGRVPQDDQPLTGGSFRGRSARLRALSDWLEGGPGKVNLQLVTGTPGVGKSALIGMLVCAAHPRLSEATRALWWGRRDDLPSVLGELAAVHAREQDTTTVLGQAAEQLSLPDAVRAWTVPAFIAALRERATVPVLVVDAVDEAVDPWELVAMLRDLADAVRDDGGPVCRLLIGSRSGRHWPAVAPLLDRAAASGALVDLDDEPRAQLEVDLYGYVDDLLRAHPQFRDHGSRAVRAALAGGISRRLAEPVPEDGQPRWGEFLVAGLFVNHVARLPAPSDETGAETLAGTVPRTLPEVLELDLRVPSHPWLRPVLATLAHSFGAGMPRSLIAACSSVFAPDRAGAVAEREIAVALDRARFYLRRDVDSDATTVYRLFHQALNDHLRTEVSGSGSTAAVHQALLDRLLAGPTGAGWRNTSVPYLLRHTIDHASAAGRVDDLLGDPEFVVHADPTTVSRHLHRARTPSGRATASVYRTSYPHHRELSADPVARRSLLLVDAVRHDERGLAHRLAAAGATAAGAALRWQPTWATATAITPALRHTLMGHIAWIHGLACTRLADGRDVTVTAGADGTARVWDTTDGSLYHLLVGHRDAVIAVACGRDAGVDVVVTAGADHRVRVWDLADGTLRYELDVVDTAAAVVRCADLRDGTTVAITGSSDGAVRVWRLADGTARFVLTGHGHPVTDVAYTRLVDGTDVAVTVSADQTARVWDLSDGSCRHLLKRHRRAVRAVACTRVDEQTDVAVTAGVDHTAVVWDLADGSIRSVLTGHTGTVRAVACLGTPDGRAVALTVGADAVARVWDLPDGRMRHEWTAHTDMLSTVTGTVLRDGAAVAVTAGMDGTARVWGLTDGHLRHILSGHADTVTALACARDADGRDLAITAGADGVARVWDIAGSGRRQLSGHTDAVRAIAVATMEDGTAVAVSTSVDGTARVWGLADGRTWHVLTGHTDAVGAVACARLADGATVAVTASTDGSVCGWDLGTGSPRGMFGRHSGPVSALVPARLANGLDVVASIGRDRAIKVWRQTDGAALATLTGYLDPASPIACARLADGTDVVVARSRDGMARVWRLADGTRLHLPEITGFRHEADGMRVSSGDVFLYGQVPDGWEVAYLSSGVPCRVQLATSPSTVVVTCARLSDGTPVAIRRDRDRVVRLYSLADGEVYAELPGRVDPPELVATTPVPGGGDVLALASRRRVHLWIGGPSWEYESLPMPAPVTALAGAPDGSILVGFGSEICRLAATPPGRSA